MSPSGTSVFYPLILIIGVSCAILSHTLNEGLSVLLVLSGFVKFSVSQGRVSSDLTRCSSHLPLLAFTMIIFYTATNNRGARGGVVVKALRYKPAGRGFDSRWCQDFSP